MLRKKDNYNTSKNFLSSVPRSLPSIVDMNRPSVDNGIQLDLDNQSDISRQLWPEFGSENRINVDCFVIPSDVESGSSFENEIDRCDTIQRLSRRWFEPVTKTVNSTLNESTSRIFFAKVND